MARKISIIIFILIAVGMGMTACNDKPKTQDPQCNCTNNVHDGACPAPCPGKGINPPCDCRDPNPCLCPDQANHLANGESKSCTGEPCKHTCTEQTAVITGTTIPITKAAGVTVDQMDEAVAAVNSAHGSLDGTAKTNFAKKVTGVCIVLGDNVSFSNGVLNVGQAAQDWQIADSFDDNNLLTQLQLQPQTKNTFLADKKNKGRAWVGNVKVSSSKLA